MWITVFLQGLAVYLCHRQAETAKSQPTSYTDDKMKEVSLTLERWDCRRDTPDCYNNLV